jgi:peptidyl-prolyl cis-trans isomerase D
MSIIQTIRDKYAKWAVVGIALAIIGFLLMDAKQGRSRLLSGSGRGTVGSVNGSKISYEDFSKQVEVAKRNIEAQPQQQGLSSDAKTNQAVDGIWNQEVNKIILDAELDKLGISITENERADMIAGEHPMQEAQQYLGQQGQPYNGAQALQTVNQIKRGNNADQKAQLTELLNYFDRRRLEEKYNSLFSGSANVPRWIIESENADASRIANVSFIQVKYIDSTLFNDTAIKITDDEIMAYVNKHKKQYKQNESRSVSYVAFSAAPSKADTAAAKDKVASLTEKFKNAPDAKIFLDGEGSDFPYSDNFVRAADMKQANKDTLLKIPVGGVNGPYLDNTHFVTAKMIESRMIPDSVTVRHILVKTADLDRSTGVFTQTRDTAEARKFLTDSIVALINKGVPFDSLCKKYSDDGGSKDSGGLYKNVKWQGMVGNFNDYIFTNAPGSKAVVYTEFGFHYIEVLKHFGAADNRIVKIAFLSKEIVTSPETETEVSGKANVFAGKARDQKTFDEVFEKELKPIGLNKGLLPNIGPAEYNFGALGESRSLIKKIYEAKKGEVLQPEKVGMDYVVAVVTEILNEGTQNASTARMSVEYALRNKKKAELIRKKVGTITTLEAAAAVLGKTVQSVDSISSSNLKVLAREQKLLGAAFNPANKGKVVPEVIEGSEGVYLLQVRSTGTAPLASANVTEQRAGIINARKFNIRTLQALRDGATIKDKRKDYY